MRTLLITGGTGSFGNAMLDAVYQQNVYDEIRIFSRDEKKQYDMRQKYPDSSVKFIIGDVRDVSSVKDVMQGVTHVFHAAAMKQVPSCEEFPLQAIETNVIGSKNVLSQAIANHVERVVVLSTDKAVMPVNTMGMTKALMEKLMLYYAMQDHNTVICATRYGNVMSSRGSVIPLFIDKLMHNKSMPVTAPTMTRFMMALDQAIELVRDALLFGERGEILVYKPKAATVLRIAEALYGLYRDTHTFETGDDLPPIQIVGARPGEKYHETLITAEEANRCVEITEDTVSIKPISAPPRTSKEEHPAYTSDTAQQLSVVELMDMFRQYGIW